MKRYDPEDREPKACSLCEVEASWIAFPVMSGMYWPACDDHLGQILTKTDPDSGYEVWPAPRSAIMAMKEAVHGQAQGTNGEDAG